VVRILGAHERWEFDSAINELQKKQDPRTLGKPFRPKMGRSDPSFTAPSSAMTLTATAIHYSLVESPIGDLLLSGDSQSLTGVHLCKQKHTPVIRLDWIQSDSLFAQARQQLREYFEGERFTFDLPVAPIGTEFQKRVWKALGRIRYGTTCCYGEIAGLLGNSNASRAVGMANGRNPISIIVPCHRVIGADGSLTGYGGGLDAKKWLLDHESRYRETP